MYRLRVVRQHLPLAGLPPEAAEDPEVAYGEECWHCNACVLDCPAKAVSLRLPLNYMLLHVGADTLHS